MIELENLDNQSLQDILDEAKKQIQYISDEWTNLQESDPGITLIELFVWLKSVQHEYLNRISPGVKNKFLDLLDIKRYKDKGSECLLEISDLSKDVHVPQGTHWIAGDMIFENPKRQWMVESRILNVSFENPDFSLNVEYYKFDNSRMFHLFGNEFRDVDKDKSRVFTIHLDKPLPSYVPTNLYFRIDAGKGLIRNPVKDSDGFIEVAKLKWEYYGNKNGKLGWYEIEILEDTTHRFLFTGIVRMKIDGAMSSLNAVYSIRCSLLDDSYDSPPKIREIRLNVLDVVQGVTKCENIIIKKDEIIDEKTVEVYTHTAIYGDHVLYVKKLGGWIETKDFTFERDIEKGKLVIDVSKIKHIYKDYPENDETLMVVSYDKSIEDNVILGSGTGTSLQHAEIDYKDILYDGFGIMVGIEKEGEMVFSSWKRVDDFFSSGKYDKHFVLDSEEELVIFGDHENGMAPRKGKDNIRLICLKFCRGENSNVREGMINFSGTENSVINGARILQITPAVGGRNRESLEHAQARASDLFSDSGRAVTMDDYEKIVKSTPGMVFKNVKILPNYMPGEDCMRQSCITVAVRWNDKIGITLPKSYEKNIMNQINKHRLVNTKVKVVSPEYIGIIVSGEIVVSSFYRQEENLIEKSIYKFVDKLNYDLGQTLHFGDMFGMIDRLNYVSYLENLRIIPVGNYIQKTVSEDIVIPPNGVYYIERIELNYVKSSDIYRS